ncbi:MAG TPA: hypothetical protein VG713_02975 [Pirellulales bacterium]|nr:hypothetical protein [Pirellulales bacterium]
MTCHDQGDLWQLGRVDEAHKQAQPAVNLGFRVHWVFDELGM